MLRPEQTPEFQLCRWTMKLMKFHKSDDQSQPKLSPAVSGRSSSAEFVGSEPSETDKASIKPVQFPPRHGHFLRYLDPSS